MSDLLENYVITDAAPVKRAGRQGAGRRPEFNPFHEAVAEIVGQVDDEGNARVKSTEFTLATERAETLKQRSGRIRRFLTRAAKDLADKAGLDEHYRINLVVEQARRDDEARTVKVTEDGQPVYVAKFWDSRAGK